MRSAVVSDIRRARPELADRLGGRARLRAADRAVSRRPPRRSRSDCAAGGARRSRRPRGASMRAFRARAARDALRGDPRPAGAGQGRADRAHGARHAPRLRPHEHSRAARNARRRRASSRSARPALRRRAAAISPARRSAIAPTVRRAGTCACRATAPAMPDRPYVVVLHATSRDDKLWPEAHWRAVLEHFDRRRVRERAAVGKRMRRKRAAAGSRRGVAKRTSSRHGCRCRDVAALLARAALADRRRHGLHASRRRAGHADDRALHRHRPARHGVACAGRARARPGRRRRAPTPGDVIARGRRDAARGAALLNRGCALVYTLLWLAALAVPAAAPVVARPRASPATGRMSANASAAMPAPRAAPATSPVDPCGFARRNARRRAADRAAAARAPAANDPADAHDGHRSRSGPCAVRRSRRAGLAALRRSVRGARVPRAFQAARGPARRNRAVAEPHRGGRARTACR